MEDRTAALNAAVMAATDDLALVDEDRTDRDSPSASPASASAMAAAMCESIVGRLPSCGLSVYERAGVLPRHCRVALHP